MTAARKDGGRAMLKTGLKRTAVMLTVYLVCVGSIVGLLIYNFQSFETDYSESALGEWQAMQYFKNKVVCPYDGESGYRVSIRADGFRCVFLNGDAPVEGTFTWKNGYSGTVRTEDGFESFVSVDMNTRGDLKLNVSEKGIIILLRRVEDTGT